MMRRAAVMIGAISRIGWEHMSVYVLVVLGEQPQSLSPSGTS
jgi:hypothetical protein